MECYVTNLSIMIEGFLFPRFPNQMAQVHHRNTGVGLLGKFGQTDLDLQSDMPRKPTKKDLLPQLSIFQVRLYFLPFSVPYKGITILHYSIV